MRACIITATVANAPILKRHLPPNVTVHSEREFSGRPVIAEIRLEGDGLPPWCESPPDGALLMRATAELLEDGVVRLIPGYGMPEIQVPDKFKE